MSSFQKLESSVSQNLPLFLSCGVVRIENLKETNVCRVLGKQNNPPLIGSFFLNIEAMKSADILFPSLLLAYILKIHSTEINQRVMKILRIFSRKPCRVVSSQLKGALSNQDGDCNSNTNVPLASALQFEKTPCFRFEFASLESL